MSQTFQDASEDGKALIGQASGDKGIGVYGDGKAVGVRGDGTTWHGVAGLSKSTVGGVGVYGKNMVGGTGVIGESDGWMGVYGKSTSTAGGAGVMGEGDSGPGIIGKSSKWVGVYGETAGIENGPAGVWGEHKGAGVGVKAVSKDGVALFAFCEGGGAIIAETQSPSSAALVAKNAHGQNAAIFEGNVVVTGDITLPNADCAEDFDVVHPEHAEPGTVMVFGVDGALTPSESAYDKRVAGVVSGAGAYRPALRLDRQSGDADNRRPIALVGKVYCKVDASYGRVSVGDPLTTSPTAGHAMKAEDPLRSFGAVLGKALQPLDEGCGLIPVLVSLQ